ncbi:MAG: hypothetical protein ACP5JP_08150, partial [bacterium]
HVPPCTRGFDPYELDEGDKWLFYSNAHRFLILSAYTPYVGTYADKKTLRLDLHRGKSIPPRIYLPLKGASLQERVSTLSKWVDAGVNSRSKEYNWVVYSVITRWVLFQD